MIQFVANYSQPSNNIVNNLNQVFIESATCFDNFWDDGIGVGNYWSDYYGEDNGSGGRTAGDGIGDTEIPHPYTDQGNGYYQLDNYPLMKPYLDLFSPQIELIFPENNSVIKRGVNISFSIFDMQIDSVNYSINGSMKSSLEFPYEIPTAEWNDGLYEILIEAKDTSNNYAVETFLITIDSKPPLIFLNSPVNNSTIHIGTILDFSISDANLFEVIYSVNGGENILLSHPYNVSTLFWPDGYHEIQIQAYDKAGNSNSSLYNFIIDMTSPEIKLNAPNNNSFFAEGTILDFSIFDPNLIEVNYNVNGLLNVSLSDPFNISTVGWQDGEYKVQINAIDLLGNSNSSWYIFTIDSFKPMIILNSPINNSIIPAKTILNFSIIDLNLYLANYSLNGGADIPLSYPFNVSTTGWIDRDNTVQITAVDVVGNSNTSWFFFTIDSKEPTIILISPSNNSIIPAGTSLEFSIIEPNLSQANYSVNGLEGISVSEPFSINTEGWADGAYTVQINASDLAGNSNSSLFLFTID